MKFVLRTSVVCGLSGQVLSLTKPDGIEVPLASSEATWPKNV